ncbi:hypothetical protein [Winogradskya humida]|uniref:Uncharacterized protein n=1 Tax=Winogradskya humida TaxID=113566 RepID=A0ABQ3ZPH3_9ACTN|nr:hypothetical protein [Actinoplanes humidus]GIE20490.1 hypothetical protein Ahu01nite_035920 [Actinoplanes humidus]
MIDELVDYGSRIRLRAGHWAVTVTGGQYDADLPLLVEVDFTYGADLCERLAQLANPRDHPEPVDWDAVAFDLPADYRWLMEDYEPAVLGDHLTLTPPAALPAPMPGPTVGMLRYLTPPTLTVATMVDGSTVAYVLNSDVLNSRWSLRITDPDQRSWDLPRNILYLLTILLTDARDRL